MSRRAGVELALDLRALDQPLARLLDDAAAGLEDRHRRARPHEHAHRDALRRLGQQVAHRARLARARVEVGLEVPRADVHVALGVADRLGHRRQRVLAVDQDLERVALARRRGRLRPQALARRRDRRELPVAAQAAQVVMDHRALDAVAHGGIDAVEYRDLHVSSRTR